MNGWLETAIVNVLAAMIVFAIAIVPIPLARGLWVWLWWGTFSDDDSFFRLGGRRITAADIDRVVGEDSLWSLVPYSKFWRDVRHNLLRKLVIE